MTNQHICDKLSCTCNKPRHTLDKLSHVRNPRIHVTSWDTHVITTSVSLTIRLVWTAGWGAEESILKRDWELPPLAPMRAEQGIWELPEAEEAQACRGRSSLRNLGAGRQLEEHGGGSSSQESLRAGCKVAGELGLEPTTAPCLCEALNKEAGAYLTGLWQEQWPPGPSRQGQMSLGRKNCPSRRKPRAPLSSAARLLEQSLSQRELAIHPHLQGTPPVPQPHRIFIEQTLQNHPGSPSCCLISTLPAAAPISSGHEVCTISPFPGSTICHSSPTVTRGPICLIQGTRPRLDSWITHPLKHSTSFYLVPG